MKPNAIFIDNHVKDIAAVDFFTVSTVAFRTLYCFVGLLAPGSLFLLDSVDGKDHWTTKSRPVVLYVRGHSGFEGTGSSNTPESENNPE